MARANRIYLVADDEKPDMTFSLTDASTDSALDLSASTTTIAFWFREAGNTDESIFTVACTKVGTGDTGQVTMAWPTNGLDDLDGEYEGEIVITWNSKTQTIYDMIRFTVRDDFPAVG